MTKRFWLRGLLSLILTVPAIARGNSFYSRSPQFNLPQGDIAFLGCYWAPVSIITGGGGLVEMEPPSIGPKTQVFKSGNLSVGIDPGAIVDLFGGGEPKPPTSGDATTLVNQATLDRGKEIGLPLAPVSYSTPYQNALLMHILNPAKWGYNPKLTSYCGNRPYILVGVIDYCGVFEGATKIREKENGQKIDYSGKRSVLERDGDVFAPKDMRHSVALEFFLVSTADGKTVWHGNVLNRAGKGNNYKGLVNDLTEDALKNLARK